MYSMHLRVALLDVLLCVVCVWIIYVQYARVCVQSSPGLAVGGVFLYGSRVRVVSVPVPPSCGEGGEQGPPRRPAQLRPVPGGRHTPAARQRVADVTEHNI